MAQRELYIDRLRTVMTALVLFHHTALAYGAFGTWFWREIKPSHARSSFLLNLFCTTNQAYFMAFFFLLAGYFTPISLDRKGYGQFIRDRLIRLGIPTLAFGFILGPLTVALVTAAQGKGFWPAFVELWHRKEFNPGPLWFAEALLIFSLNYVLWRRIRGPQPGDPLATKQTPSPVPSGRAWLLSALIVGAGALAIRQVLPVGTGIFPYFAPYIFLFAVGIAARRHDWLSQLTWEHARPWIIIACIAWPTLPLASRFANGHANFTGGLSWPAILYALWEPFVAWGVIAAWLLWFRARVNQPSAFWNWLSRRAYAVYIIHPPVLVGISLLLRAWAAPALVKFGATGTLTCAAAWLISDPIVRLPGLKRIV
jgi:peptidoglycan/LPS O-acetylase OafA/YrhL